MINRHIDFNLLIKKAKGATGVHRPVKIALLADFASQHLAKAIRAAAAITGFQADIWEAEYDTIASTIIDETSDLYQQNFDYVLIFHSSLKLYKEFSSQQAKADFADSKLMGLSALISVLQERSRARIIVSNYNETDDGVWGHYANKTKLSFLYQVRKLNLELMHLAAQRGSMYVLDVQSLAAESGKAATFNPRLYVLTDIIYDLDFLALLAQKTLQIIRTIEGSFIKCVILDLDNTLWGGVIGDDGLENIQIGELGLGKAFSNLQLWLRNLKERGIILAVCSKNDEQVAKAAFIEHAGMTLCLHDIAVFVANWETKVDNIMFIQSVLNLGYDSMVFLDDNPFEREMVRRHLPEVTVPDLPEDPVEVLPYLQSLQLFETASYSGDDAIRTQQYQEEANRAALHKRFSSEAEFLASLAMQAVCKPVDSFSCPRVAQLTQRSNQFNLRTRRYTEAEMALLMKDSDRRTLALSLSDVFGYYGLVSAVLLEKRPQNELFIDTWIMSCRVLKRGVENFLLNEMVSLAKREGFQWLTGEYIPTAKNGLVKDHYQKLGFAQGPEKNTWILSVEDYQPKQTFITKTTDYAYHE